MGHTHTRYHDCDIHIGGYVNVRVLLERVQTSMKTQMLLDACYCGSFSLLPFKKLFMKRFMQRPFTSWYKLSQFTKCQKYKSTTSVYFCHLKMSCNYSRLVATQ